MTQGEQIALLRRHEWRDVEFKEAQCKEPRDACETLVRQRSGGGRLAR